jgi:membrane protein implicated in regulation of membrane protease activity
VTAVLRALATGAAALAPAAAAAQGQVVAPGTGWPVEWLLFLFAVGALVAVMLLVIFAVRWRSDPPRPGRPR